MGRTYDALFVGFLALCLTGCVSVVRPTIAHVHVGHAITGWADTPERAGLLVVAERDAATAAEHARYAIEGAAELATLRMHIVHVVQSVDPTVETEGPGSGYGLARALQGTADHLRFAAESSDASQNLKQSVGPLVAAAAAVRRDGELIVALGREIKRTQKLEDAVVLAMEVRALADKNQAALRAFRKQLQELLARENPPFTTIETRYLFGLIRLPGGEWQWRPDLDRPAGQSGADGYSGYR